MNFATYNKRFVDGTKRHRATIHTLSNGALLATIGDPRLQATTLFLSGLHGDERSGPLAILELLGDDLSRACADGGFCLQLCPLLNDLGWDAGTREWGALDLNRAFGGVEPPFLAELTKRIALNPPTLYADLHEDSDTPYPYLFRCTSDQHPLVEHLAEHLEAELEPWSLQPLWSGSSEVWIRGQGCERATTTEAPPVWPLDQRIAWQLQALRWLLNYPSMK